MKSFASFRKMVASLVQEVIPTNKAESNVLAVLFLYYLLIGCLFFFISLPKDQWLGMMGYDTQGHVTYEPQMLCFKNLLTWNIRHPLYTLLYLPVIILNEGFLALGIHLTWQVFLLSSIFLMSMSGLFVYKTIRLVGLENREAGLILAVFVSFAHVTFLGIQVDSFVISVFFGSLMLYLFAKGYHNFLTDNLLFFGITGTTSTNVVKFAFYQFLEEKSFSKFVARFSKSLWLFCLLFVLTLPNLCMRLVERPRGLMYAVIGDSMNFRGTNHHKLQLFLENYISEPLLFHHTDGIIFSEETVCLPDYASLFYYFPVLSIWVMVLLSVYINRHSKVIHLFVLCFGFDLIMHFLVGYGMEEGQLFCGHWIFFIPVVLGLMVKKMGTARLWLCVLLCLCFLEMLFLNSYHLIQSL